MVFILIQALFVSTFTILLFGEIIPQAICNKHGLAVGAFFAYPLRFLIFLLYIVAFPISKLLDFIVGKDQTLFYRRGGYIFIKQRVKRISRFNWRRRRASQQ